MKYPAYVLRRSQMQLQKYFHAYNDELLTQLVADGMVCSCAERQAMIPLASVRM
jgi:hypothetical protein